MKEPVKYKEGLNIYRQLDKCYFVIAGLYTKLVTVLQGNKLLPLRLTVIICISNQPPRPHHIYHLACSFTNSENFNQY